ncbi:hypothetical protein [Nocardiopsis synnemataformans]|uniref:LexA family protein n=1 Tax=Nocardiopsis synnemataformans TaxID=61305 RepID=UPI003EBAABF0
MTRRPALTRRQTAILQVYLDYAADLLKPPSLREIADEVGMHSASGVGYQVDLLVQKGYLVRHDYRAGRTAVSLPTEDLDAFWIRKDKEGGSAWLYHSSNPDLGGEGPGEHPVHQIVDGTGLRELVCAAFLHDCEEADV